MTNPTHKQLSEIRARLKSIEDQARGTRLGLKNLKPADLNFQSDADLANTLSDLESVDESMLTDPCINVQHSRPRNEDR